MPGTGPPVTASAATTRSTRSGRRRPGSGSRLTIATWREDGEDEERRGHERAAQHPHRHGPCPAARVDVAAAHDHADHAEAREVREGGDQGGLRERPGLAGDGGDRADRDPGDVGAAAHRAEGDQGLAGLERGAGAEQPQPQHVAARHRGPGAGDRADLAACRPVLTPTVAEASVASRTVEVLGPTLVTVPTRPSPLRTVSLAWIPSRLPGVDRDGVGVVAARRDHAGGDDLVAARAVELEQLAELLRVGLARPGACELGAELVVLLLQVRDLAAVVAAAAWKNPSMGRATSPAAFSTGPNSELPAPLALEVPPSRKSTVISAMAAISSTARARRVRRLPCKANSVSAPRSPKGSTCLANVLSAGGQGPVPGAACRSPPRTCRCRAPRSRAGCPRCAPACPSPRGCAGPGRAAARRRR